MALTDPVQAEKRGSLSPEEQVWLDRAYAVLAERGVVGEAARQQLLVFPETPRAVLEFLQNETIIVPQSEGGVVTANALSEEGLTQPLRGEVPMGKNNEIADMKAGIIKAEEQLRSELGSETQGVPTNEQNVSVVPAASKGVSLDTTGYTLSQSTIQNRETLAAGPVDSAITWAAAMCERIIKSINNAFGSGPTPVATAA